LLCVVFVLVFLRNFYLFSTHAQER
jgi:hypothetical protein